MRAEMTTFQLNGLYKLVLSASRPGEADEGNIEGMSIDFSLDTPITVGVYHQPED